jgi:hypothetical protein
MTFLLRFLPPCAARLSLVSLLLWGGLAVAGAADLKLEALLIWGTNDEKSPDPAHRPVDPALAKKLAALPFKWKNYFEVNRKIFTANDKDYTTNVMSKKCTIAVKDAGNSMIKVKMTGDGKEWHRQVKPLPKGETVIIGGDDKNQSAWLVVLRHQESKAQAVPTPRIASDAKAK